MLTDDQLVSECPVCNTLCEPDQIWTDSRDREASADYNCPRCKTPWSVLTGAMEVRFGAFPLDLWRYDLLPDPEFIDLGSNP